MVVTRSARPQARGQATSPESSRQKNSAAKRIEAHPKGRKESPSDDPSTAESQSTRKRRPVSRTPKTGRRKSRTTGLLCEQIDKPSTDGETSEAESTCSSVSERQSPILRITRRRQILIACTPVSSARKRLKITPINESPTEEVSEAESHVSGISRIVLPAVITTRTRRSKVKSLTDPSQESHMEAISDAESSCSDMSSFSGISTRRTTRSMQRKLQAQTEEKDNITEEKQANVAPLKEIIKQNCRSLDEEAKGMINEGKEINEKNSQFKSLSELKDTSIQHLLSQRHSTPQNKKTTSEPSNLNCEAIMKSLAQTFAVVEVDRWNEKRQSTIKTRDLTEFGDGSGSDEEECTVIGVCQDTNEERDVDFEGEDVNKERDTDFECDTKLYRSEFNTSQDKGDSVLLVLSSDESQQSKNSENEEDTVCFVENSGQKESLNEDLENMLCDNALFVIDTTPGLSADKNFYLDEEDKTSEVAIEEEKEEEEEDEKSEEEPSDSDKNKDSEFSDEDDLLNGTKSKLLKLTSSSIDPGLSIKQLGGLYINFSADKLQSNKRTLTQIKEKKKNELLQKAVITPDFEKNYCVPPYRESKYQLQKKRRKERQKTAGDGWFGMKAPELTDELKNDLKVLKMRASMDPKRFYKKNDRDGFPKYFQIGTIVDNPADFYHSRIPKKQRKRTIVEELLADSEFRRYNRRKYSEIMAEKAANAAGKKFRKKKKFRN
ncbi:PREDICTED: deoxynucleotidyltransferase terminal-interacting protein 2 isoform X2 [Ceratotherium simum simum]|uniref:Deoxynucleotidyltransferase terminal-interacting protein 2 isoform X2 n=1 Tax=Ceratotherium simum simum TaxID=73337 RepID=A0ABM1C7U3_CERSS|nr:PREDICTED: deoxynucleotidyltransferase terminal-interacting protein 2 isoform X2 [Ceratotherium simum simum]